MWHSKDCDTEVENYWNKLFLNKNFLKYILQCLIYIGHYNFLVFFSLKRIFLEIYKEACFLQIYMKIGLVSLMKNLWLEKFWL